VTTTMPSFADFFKDKYEYVKDESTGEMIMVDKSAPKYKLDENGNIINPPDAGAAAGGGAGANGGGNAFAAAVGAGGGGGGGGGGFTFGVGSGGGSAGGFKFGTGDTGGSAAGGGFTFGGKSVPAAPVSGGGGFVFGANSDAGGVAAKKRAAEEAGPRAKRLRSSALQLRGDESGGVLIVGNGDCGQLGLGGEDDSLRDTLTPVPIPSLGAVRVCALACGGLHTAALTLDGRVWTWGCNDDEVLGRAGEESEPGLVQGALSGVQVKMISAGDSHMAALGVGGEVFSWGTYKDSNGYIGYTKELKKAGEPQQVSTLKGRPMKWVASGADHTIAVAADGLDVYLWGCGEKGQLAQDLQWEGAVKQQHLEPTQPVQLRLPSVPGCDTKSLLVRTLNENLITWMRLQMEADEAFDATEACSMYLSHQAELQKGGALEDRLRVRAAFGGAYHTFLLTESSNVYACGLNNMGQLGLGSLEPGHTGTPTLVTALEGKGVCQLSAGEHHSLALTKDGQVFAFGRGDNNQLGTGDGSDMHTSPVKLDALDGIHIRKVASGSNQNVAVASSGDLYTWGFGEMGALAHGSGQDERRPRLVETKPVAAGAVLDAASGAQHTAMVILV